MKDEKYNNLRKEDQDRIAAGLQEHNQEFATNYCKLALKAANPLCVFSAGRYILSSSGYRESLYKLLTYYV